MVEGIEFLATSNKIPKFIRILVMIIISAVLLAVVCISTAFIFKASETGLRVVAGIIDTLALFLLVYFQICWWRAITTK